MIKLYPRQATGYPPLEQGQVLEMGPNCMKVNFGFGFIRGVLTGMIAMVLFPSLVFDIIIGDLWTTHSLFFGFIKDIAGFKYWVIPAVLLELYLWPSAPPMIFDRVNRRVIFQVLFRTKIIAWDDCVASIHYFAQATQASATQGYNLRIEGEVINRKPGQKPQRAAALIHQSGISEDLLNYWEYIRNYMDGGQDAVPKPTGIHQINPFWAALLAFHSNIPDPTPIFKALGRGEGGIKGTAKNILILLMSTFLFLITPVVYPLLLMVYIAGRTGRVRRYPKEIRALCKRGRATETVHKEQPAPLKLKIQIDGKLVETDWPADAWKRSSPPKPPPPQ